MYASIVSQHQNTAGQHTSAPAPRLGTAETSWAEVPGTAQCPLMTTNIRIKQKISPNRQKNHWASRAIPYEKSYCEQIEYGRKPSQQIGSDCRTAQQQRSSGAGFPP